MKLPGLSVPETAAILPRNYALLAYRGSIAHGMYVPQDNPTSIDDKDIMGVHRYIGGSAPEADLIVGISGGLRTSPRYPRS